MSLELRVGKISTLTATPSDASGTLDPNAIDTWVEDSAGVVISLSDNGGGTATVTGVAEGVANVVATATDPDGNTVDSLPFEVTVKPAFASTDAVSVTITASAPV